MPVWWLKHIVVCWPLLAIWQLNKWPIKWSINKLTWLKCVSLHRRLNRLEAIYIYTANCNAAALKVHKVLINCMCTHYWKCIALVIGNHWLHCSLVTITYFVLQVARDLQVLGDRKWTALWLSNGLHLSRHKHTHWSHLPPLGHFALVFVSLNRSQAMRCHRIKCICVVSAINIISTYTCRFSPQNTAIWARWP